MIDAPIDEADPAGPPGGPRAGRPAIGEGEPGLPATATAVAEAAARPSSPRNRAELDASNARAAASGRRMAAMTATCLVAATLGWAAEVSGAVPRATATALYALAYLAGGFDSTRKALGGLRRGSLGVDMLMILAATGAAAVGERAEGAVLLFLFSLSNTLEHFVLGRTRRAIQALMDLAPEEAVVRRDGVEACVPVEELGAGETIVVRPGERIAADGVVRAGRTAVDQSAMTGESIPVEKGVGDPVFAATLNGAGAIEVEVTRLAGQTTLARIVRLVEEAQGAKAVSQRFTDWFGSRYTLAVLLGATLTMLVPILSLGEPLGRAFYRAMTVLVVASPCAVVISIPAAILSAIAGAARGGVLFKGGAHLERAATLRAIAFDKTGTLTIGRPRLVELIAAEGRSAEEVLRLAASAEGRSEHPLSRAVVEAAGERGVDLPEASDAEALVGRGLRARVEGRWAFVGKADLFTGRGLAIPPGLAEAASSRASAGMTTVFVGDEAAVWGVLAIADTLRPGAAEAVAQLRALGVEHLVMLTGDHARVAGAIAGRLGMEYQADLFPEDKLRVIRELRGRYGDVAMVGDGINDAPALAAASLGISIGGGGTDVALETADVVLMSGDLRHLPHAIALARAADRVIRQNLLFAFGVMATLLAVTFAGSLRLPMAVVGHEGSTVLVILNGIRLLRFRGAGG